MKFTSHDCVVFYKCFIVLSDFWGWKQIFSKCTEYNCTCNIVYKMFSSISSGEWWSASVHILSNFCPRMSEIAAFYSLHCKWKSINWMIFQDIVSVDPTVKVHTWKPKKNWKWYPRSDPWSVKIVYWSPEPHVNVRHKIKNLLLWLISIISMYFAICKMDNFLPVPWSKRRNCSIQEIQELSKNLYVMNSTAVKRR